MLNIIKRMSLLSLLLVMFFTVEVKAEEQVNRWGIVLSEKEVDLLACIVQLENGYDIIESKYAVVETIFNRVYSTDYPNTLEEVLSQKGQFSTWKHRNKAKPTEETYDAIYDVLYGYTEVLEFGRLNFNNKPIGYSPIKIGQQYYGFGRKEK